MRHVLSCVKIFGEIRCFQLVWYTRLFVDLRGGMRLLRTKHIILVCIIIAFGDLAVAQYG